MNYPEIKAILLQAGADTSLKDSAGETATSKRLACHTKLYAKYGVPRGIRTPVSAVKGQRPRPD